MSGGDFSSGDGEPIDGRKGDPVACERCASPLELLTVLPRSGDHPSFRIFACAACNFVQWIAEAIGE